jgi:hypothetical protein
MASQIKLEIETGGGNTALAANCGTLNPLYSPLVLIAFGQEIDALHGLVAGDVLANLDPAINSLRSNRYAYQVLTVAEQGYRQPLLDFCLNWRDNCRRHPNAVIYIVP